MGQLSLRPDELTCVDRCVLKNVNTNQRLMSSYIDINPGFQERKLKEQEAEVAEALKKNSTPVPAGSAPEVNPQTVK